MFVAISRNDIARVQKFLDSGLSVNAVIEEQYGHTPLAVAAYYGRYDIAQLLIDKGADVNQRSKGQAKVGVDTPLLRAIWKKQNKVAILLLQHGADPAMLTIGGRTVCEFAEVHKNLEIMPHLPNCS